MREDPAVVEKQRPLSDLELGPWFTPWQVASDGYEWYTPPDGAERRWSRGYEPKQGPFLVEKESGGVIGATFEARGYAPLRRWADGYNPVHRALWNLYRKYPPGRAGVKVTDAHGDLDAERLKEALSTSDERLDLIKRKIIEFANRYGLLGAGDVLPGTPGPMRGGESLSMWMDAIAEVGRLVSIRDAIERGDSGVLGQWFFWNESGPSVGFAWADGWRVTTGLALLDGQFPRGRRTLYSEIRKGDVLAVARYWFAETLNKALQNTVSPQLMPLRTPEVPGQMVGRLVARDLLSVAYLELWFEASGRRTYRQCEGPGCAEWVDASGKGQMRFCGTACRQRASRKRRAEASNLTPI